MTTDRATRGEWTLVGAILTVALVLRVVVALEYETNHPLADRPVIDERSYEEWGKEIADGDWIGDEVFFQEPLYPYWIGVVYSVFGESRTALRHVQAGLGALTCLLVWALGRRAFGRGPALFAAAAFAVHRPALLLPCWLLKPNLFLPIFTGLTLLLLVLLEREREERVRRGTAALWVLAGVAAGAGALLRGNVLVLLPALFLCPFLFARAASPGHRLGRALRACAALALGVALLLVPVTLRNYHVGGVFAMTTSGAGTNVYSGNNEQNPQGTPNEFDWVRGIPEYEADDWRHETERRLGRTVSPTEVSSFWLHETWASLKRDPGLHASILWNKLRLTLGRYEVPDNHNLDWDARYVSLAGPAMPGYALWGWLSLAGVFAHFARREERARRGPLLIALVAGAFAVTIVLTVTSMRVRLALVPLLLPFGGALLASATRLLSTRRGRVVLLSSLVAAALVVFPHVLTEAEREENLAVRDFNFATYRLEDGAPIDELLPLVDDLDRRYPRTLRIWSLRAEIELRMAREALAAGDEERARDIVEAARARSRTAAARSGSNVRERYRAHMLQAELARFAGDAREAEESFRAALEFDPTDPRARLGRAESLLVLGAAGHVDRLPQAVDAYRSIAKEDPEDLDARLGLANALFLFAESVEGSAREEALSECERLLIELGAAGRPVEDLLRRVREP